MTRKPKSAVKPSPAVDPAKLDDETVRVIDLVNMDSRVGREIKGLRRARGLTLALLAEATGLSQGYLSQIERGLSRPSVKALHSISRALGVTISWFFAPQTGDDTELRDYVVRAGARRRLEFENGISDELLSPNLDRRLELLRCVLPPGTQSGETPYSHQGEETGVVVSGSLDLWINDKHVVLNAGDSFAFASDIPHRYANRGEQDTIVIWAITPPSY